MSLTAPYLECHAEHPSNDPIEDTHTIVTGDDYVYVGVCEFETVFSLSSTLQPPRLE